MQEGERVVVEVKSLEGKSGWDPTFERRVFDTSSILGGGKIGVNPYRVRLVDLGVGREEFCLPMSSILLVRYKPRVEEQLYRSIEMNEGMQ